MNVAAHQEKEKNEKTGRKKAREERRQATDFKDGACCPLAVVQGAARQKNGLREGSVRGNWDSREGQQPFRPNPNEVGIRTTTLRRLLIGAVHFARVIYCINDKNFSLHYSERLGSIRVLRTNRTFILMIRVKVN